jgi:hypothetical protein
MKTCFCCKQSFPLEEMRRAYCKYCKSKLEVKRNPVRAQWNKDNKDLTKQYSFKYTQSQRKDPLRNFMWACNIGLSRALRGGWYNDKKMKEWVGLVPSELKLYIQSQWEEGMSWENYGRKKDCWNIDHIIPPYSSTTKDEIIKLQHYTNLRPLWHSDNVRKRNKRS